MDILLWIIFIAISIFLVIVSRKTMKDPHSHGFFRFFAFELISLLVLFQIPIWFTDPWQWNQIISWILLILSIVFVIIGVKLLKQLRKNPKSDASTRIGRKQKPFRI